MADLSHGKNVMRADEPTCHMQTISRGVKNDKTRLSGG
ncbi:hypothetical protein APS_1513 [Acetobacter pasteurianus subsp. pasteurianus LMG 1262 = NBRC 106471]|nr:hypothetical protein APS_1513 [Acetobacter pasteurianus subsp. pasteurianus LMG 1262 = NBRC 106471]